MTAFDGMDDIVEVPVYDARRTGPELRRACVGLLNSLAIEVGQDHPDILQMLANLGEMARRSPKYKVARSRDPDPTPEQVKRIRALKFGDPDLSHKEIAKIVDNTSTRCVSLALVGRRDGSSVYGPDGDRIKRERKRRAKPAEPAEPAEAAADIDYGDLGL